MPDVEDFARLRSEFLNYGYAIVRSFASSSLLSEINTNIERYIAEIVPRLSFDFAFYGTSGDPRTLRQLNNMQLQDDYFASIFGGPPWRDLAATLLEEDVEGCGMQWYDKPPGIDYPTPPHQDNSSMNFLVPSAVGMWLALDAVDEGNGCLRYLPGSHRLGLRLHVTAPVVGFCRRIPPQAYGPDDLMHEAPICLEPGDLVAHHPLTVHRAEANASATRHRRALLQLFRGASAHIDEVELQRYEGEVQRNRHRAQTALDNAPKS